ncbi:hypothetical protein M3182_14695 [Mesobacillus maritimus]|uniref:hypothetical protein n=1 Tax=Mesobacillus maritimus TaxID=1643336 RepID=UPI00203FB197|nr:hypothetical protein [Mesobacillus maritimus]MCM3586984.1 hypothetical protein [Mesobacillus maritimus]
MNKEKIDLIFELTAIYDRLNDQQKKLQNYLVKERIEIIRSKIKDLMIDLYKMDNLEPKKKLPTKNKPKAVKKNEKKYNHYATKNKYKKENFAPKGRNSTRTSSSHNSSGGFKYKSSYNIRDYEDY